MTADIVLCTINARWSHASFGLRCLRANLGDLRARSAIVEKTLEHRAVDIVEAIAAHDPKIVGLGVYIWNASVMLDVARILKRVRPDVALVIGGPEVSHEIDAQPIGDVADVVVAGEGDVAFRDVCARILDRRAARALDFVPDKIVRGGSPRLDAVAFAYDEYDDVDVKDRVVYVEASRGCPFTCSFCLSALDDGVRAFPLGNFLDELDRLHRRGLRHFKFVDRTFNLKIDDAARILDFFLARPDTFAHFEMIPDRLPAALRERLARFEPGRVQLEVGIQTLNHETATLIRRRLDVDKIEDNLRFLRDHTGVHVHADLIAGLPGEDFASFARGFDRLFAWGTAEIQVGILKRLRGSPLAKDATEHPAWRVVFDAAPPYQVLSTSTLSFEELQRISRFARALDLVHNSGRFPNAAKLLFDRSPFRSFDAFSDWLFRETGARHGIALPRLTELIARHLRARGVGDAVVARALESDLGRDRMPKIMSLPDRQARRANR